MFPAEYSQPRTVNGITLLGPDFFTSDRDGKPLSPLGVIFPNSLILVTGRGIHAELIAAGEEFLRAQDPRNRGAGFDGGRRAGDL